MQDRFKDHPLDTKKRDPYQFRGDFVLTDLDAEVNPDYSFLKPAFFGEKPETGSQEIEEDGRVTSYGGVSFASGKHVFHKILII